MIRKHTCKEPRQQRGRCQTLATAAHHVTCAMGLSADPTKHNAGLHLATLLISLCGVAKLLSFKLCDEISVQTEFDLFQLKYKSVYMFQAITNTVTVHFTEL